MTPQEDWDVPRGPTLQMFHPAVPCCCTADAQSICSRRSQGFGRKGGTPFPAGDTQLCSPVQGTWCSSTGSR